MVSQRRSVKDLDLYSKSAEKFLSLRPNCCQPSQNEGTKSESSVPQVADRYRVFYVYVIFILHVILFYLSSSQIYIYFHTIVGHPNG